MENALLLPKTVADLLQVSTATLAGWRSKGVGPRFVKIEGKFVRYSEDALNNYLKERTFSAAAQARHYNRDQFSKGRVS